MIKDILTVTCQPEERHSTVSSYLRHSIHDNTRAEQLIEVSYVHRNLPIAA